MHRERKMEAAWAVLDLGQTFFHLFSTDFPDSIPQVSCHLGSGKTFQAKDFCQRTCVGFLQALLTPTPPTHHPFVLKLLSLVRTCP